MPVRCATDTTAVVFATTAASDGSPVAGLQVADTTVLGRLVEQLEALGIRRGWVITRGRWRDALTSVAADSSLEIAVVTADDPAAELRAVADIASGAGSLFLARGDVLTQRQAIAGLLADPRIGSGILVSGSSSRAGWSFRTRSARGRVVGAASAYHRVGEAGPFFLGLLKVDAHDRPALAAAARRLAELVRSPPDAWCDEIDRKVVKWRGALGRAVQERALPTVPDHVTPSGPSLDAAAERQLARRTAVAREDVVSLLLVGLVRHDVQIRARHLRGFFYGRPMDAGELARALEEMRGHDEDHVALKAAVKGNDSFFTTHFVSPYSKYIARFASRRGWTPNAISIVSMVIGTVAAAAFATGSRVGLVVGAVLLQAAFTADCVDGQLARYTHQFSKLGAWLDSVLDRAKEYVVYAGLAIGAQRGFGDDVWMLATAAMALQTVRHTIGFSYTARQHEVVAVMPQPPLEHPGDAYSPRGRRGGIRSATDTPGAPAEQPPPTAAPFTLRRLLVALTRRCLRLIGGTKRSRTTYWGTRILLLPIGERFALISLTAALASPRLTFVVLLAWGSAAAAYAVLTRGLWSLRHSPRADG